MRWPVLVVALCASWAQAAAELGVWAELEATNAPTAQSGKPSLAPTLAPTRESVQQQRQNARPRGPLQTRHPF